MSVLNQKESWELTNLNLKIKCAELERFLQCLEGEITLKYRILELIHRLQQFLRSGHSDSNQIKERITPLLETIGSFQITWKEAKENAFSAFRSLESLRMRSASLDFNRKKPKETSESV